MAASESKIEFVSWIFFSLLLASPDRFAMVNYPDSQPCPEAFSEGPQVRPRRWAPAAASPSPCHAAPGQRRGADMMPPPWLPSAGGGSIGCSAPPSGVQQSMAGRSPACYSTDEASFRPLIHSSECSTVHLNISACFLKIKLQLTLKLIEQMTMTVHSSRHQAASDQVANHGSVMMPSSCRMKQFGSQFLQVRTDSSLACCIVAVNESNFFKSAFLSCVITHFLISDLCIFLFCR